MYIKRGLYDIEFEELDILLFCKFDNK